MSPERIDLSICSRCGWPIDDDAEWDDHLADGCGPPPSNTTIELDHAGRLLVVMRRRQLKDVTYD